MSKHLDLAGNVAYLISPDKWINFQPEAGSQTDTTLRFVSLGSSSSARGFNKRGTKRKRDNIDGSTASGRRVPLLLDLQCSPSTWVSSGTVCTVSSACLADEGMDLDLNFQLEIENVYIPQAPAVTPLDTLVNKPSLNLQLSLSFGPSVSAITSVVGTPAQHLINRETSTVNFPGLVRGDGSVSSCWRRERSLIPYIYSSGSPSVLPPSRPVTTKANIVPNQDALILREVSESLVDCTSGNIKKQNHSSRTKNCQFLGCPRRARGASGFCIGHGGRQRCKKPGCLKGAEGKTIYCKWHGGGRRCEQLGCTKSAEGRTDFCIAHGGGRRCIQDGCIRASRGKPGLCIRHGGGRRCQKENCTKSAVCQSRLCIAHGGGRRCQNPECKKGAQGRTMFCKAHGGGKRCSFSNCGKGAEGSTPFCKGHGGGKRCLFQDGGVCPKSVHGGTQFCVAHGGGKRCAALDCTKSARGRTHYCVRHGGGRRCQHEGCDKSAQGCTNFCKAHGGGKRCSWGQAGSDIGSVAPPCNQFSRLCVDHNALLHDRRVHGAEMMETLTAQKPVPAKADKMKGIVVEEANLVGCTALNQIKSIHPIIPVSSGAASLPEGRVHGGSLMALLTKGAPLNQSESQPEKCGTSNQGLSYIC